MQRITGRTCARTALALLIVVLLSGCSGWATARPEPGGPRASTGQYVNVYSARHYGAMETALARFTKETGITVRVTQGTDQELIARLRAEGSQSPADALLSVDAASLVLAAEAGLFQPVQSEALHKRIPAELRDAQDRWFGLSQRLRAIAYHPARVRPEDVVSYEALAEPAWRGRLCLRPANHVYTISLAASLLAAHGPARASAILRGWVANTAHFIDSDAEILDAIVDGRCDAGIVNHYYLGRAIHEAQQAIEAADEEERQALPARFPLALAWPNQDDRGAHRNISGLGITANAPNRENALRLLDWLSAPGQAADRYGLPGGNYEYPVNALAPAHPFAEAFGSFKADPLPLSEYGRLQVDAIKLLAEAGYS